MQDQIDYDDERPWHRYGWVETPDRYGEQREPEADLVELTVWTLTASQAFEVAELFGDRRIEWREEDGVLVIFGLPEGSWRSFGPWFDDFLCRHGIMDNETPLEAYCREHDYLLLYRDCYGNQWDNEQGARLATALYTAFDTQRESSDAEIVAQLAEQFPDEDRTELEGLVGNVRDGWRCS